MTTHLFALGNRAKSIRTVAALVVAAVLIAGPTVARAASERPAQVLAEGAGMGAKPSLQVREVQRELQRRGYDLGPPGVDGRFGPLTDTVVRRMQADHGLAVDGAVGPHTRRALHLPTSNGGRTHTRSARRRPAEARPVDTATSPQRAVARPVVPPATGPDVSTNSSRPSTSWLELVIAALLGGLIATMAVGIDRRRPRRTESAKTRPRRTSAAEAPPPADGKRPDEPELRIVDRDDAPEAVTAGTPEPRRSRSQLAPGSRLIGYVTVAAASGSRTAERSTAERSSAAIESMCGRCDWNLVEIVRDRENGRILERPGLSYALERIVAGHADGLVISDLRRLRGSIADLGALMAWFREAEATLMAVDPQVDTSTAEGQAVADTMIALSSSERDRVASRSRNGRQNAPVSRGATGRPAVSDRPELVERIAEMRARNMTLQAIADQLNAEGVPTLRGGARWRPSSIQAALGYRRRAPREPRPPLGKRERP
jgi:DNA invertase Pin-like site-specific DNA recombinase/peptidoglycan hydrolase-like protein with peptidoglycan-binding domain